MAEEAFPELVAQLIQTSAGPGDAAIAEAVAGRVDALLPDGVLVEDEPPVARPLQPRDIAVITPHVEQASAIAARLPRCTALAIGTANQLQGLEREALVVVHPLAGYRDTPAFALDPGRLCVALSRHRTHPTVFVDAASEQVLRPTHAECSGNTAIDLQLRMLIALCRS